MNNTGAIFDMDGILIDSEPLWFEAANDVFKEFHVQLNEEQYASSLGLRTPEFVEYWFRKLNLDLNKKSKTINDINDSVIGKIEEKGQALPGVLEVLNLLKNKSCKIGLATSSTSNIIQVVLRKLNIASYFHTLSSAEKLDHGKPHPQVYLNCAESLNLTPLECFCFEDSYNGMISAKAARMRCIVVPSPLL
ncbi:MAG: hexitol phosphatase HxpB, partial [Chitinophagaceae bacterium]